MAAEAEHVADHGPDLGAGQEDSRVNEVHVVEGNVRWEPPTSRSFWGELAGPERRALAASGVEMVFRAGSVLCREGADSSQVMIIDSGWTKVSVNAGAGEQIIAVRGPGDVVGERALMARVRSASVTALDEVRAMVVEPERFAEFLYGHPRAAEVLERQVRERREELRARHFPAELAGAERRLAWLLIELAQRRGGYQQAASAAFTLPMSHQELAGWADASPDAVARVLRSWRERGIVGTERRPVSVADLDGLAAICGPAAAARPAAAEQDPAHAQRAAGAGDAQANRPGGVGCDAGPGRAT